MYLCAFVPLEIVIPDYRKAEAEAWEKTIASLRFWGGPGGHADIT